MQFLHTQTPLIESQYLKNKLNKQVYFKLECLHPPGSFKLRGIGALCQEELQRGAKTFVASSGGNAGIAVAYCAMKLNVPATVIIPETSNPIYIEAIKSYGAKVIVAGKVWDEAHQAALDFAKEHQSAYIPPFDHPTLWKGHASMITETIQQGLSKPDAVVLSVGGGGLACGVLEGMHQHGWEKVPLIAVETKGADAFFQSVKANKLVTLDTITSKATSLGAKRVAQKLMDWTKIHKIENVVVSDEEAEQACFSFAQEQRILVELSSGASLSLLYNDHPALRSAQSILVIVCGGVNTSHFNIFGHLHTN
ncbi:cysteine synthase [Legionella quinlivanii]|uniref:L-serine ammonia-lyase n=1 Tax=Legionella quinlivanii TaxID=45073 RepID=A0A0W0Y4K6_9GAMM|nr:pyridoxal-phosphate dependent enzyme [Legionella quinlivanii]KTD51864.1 cysteine synthase [Legionella quinlivanii]SEF83234.1 L-serine/L-threonine ammonia-lyase [Legionella quinlivanii DSM 21216]STY09675.1 cysteine synthase [Legionella quinlivanii]